MTRRLMRVLGTVLLVLPFMTANAYANDVPVSMKWAGTVTDAAIDTNGDGLFADLIDANVKGSLDVPEYGNRGILR